MGKGPAAVGGEGGGERRAVLHAVVVNEEQVAVFELEQIDGGVGVRERRVAARRPGPPAVVRFREHQVAVRPNHPADVLQHLRLGVLVEIDQHVAAEHDIEWAEV